MKAPSLNNLERSDSVKSGASGLSITSLGSGSGSGSGGISSVGGKSGILTSELEKSIDFNESTSFQEEGLEKTTLEGNLKGSSKDFNSKASQAESLEKIEYHADSESPTHPNPLSGFTKYLMVNQGITHGPPYPPSLSTSSSTASTMNPSAPPLNPFIAHSNSNSISSQSNSHSFQPQSNSSVSEDRSLERKLARHRYEVDLMGNLNRVFQSGILKSLHEDLLSMESNISRSPSDSNSSHTKEGNPSSQSKGTSPKDSSHLPTSVPLWLGLNIDLGQTYTFSVPSFMGGLVRGSLPPEAWNWESKLVQVESPAAAARRLRDSLDIDKILKVDARGHVVSNLYETERNYLRALEILQTNFKGRMKKFISSKVTMNLIFGGIDELHAFHKRFYAALEDIVYTWGQDSKVGEIFLHHVSMIFFSFIPIIYFYCSFLSQIPFKSKLFYFQLTTFSSSFFLGD